MINYVLLIEATDNAVKPEQPIGQKSHSHVDVIRSLSRECDHNGDRIANITDAHFNTNSQFKLMQCQSEGGASASRSRSRSIIICASCLCSRRSART